MLAAAIRPFRLLPSLCNTNGDLPVALECDPLPPAQRETQPENEERHSHPVMTNGNCFCWLVSDTLGSARAQQAARLYHRWLNLQSDQNISHPSPDTPS